MSNTYVAIAIPTRVIVKDHGAEVSMEVPEEMLAMPIVRQMAILFDLADHLEGGCSSTEGNSAAIHHDLVESASMVFGIGALVTRTAAGWQAAVNITWPGQWSTISQRGRQSLLLAIAHQLRQAGVWIGRGGVRHE
ncbi:hypothetical protein A3709_19690 [Halioglobus sp. HI00S01]|nr:hypothetical protein A3709_19690 [Halioglobus sp. HI00S01]